jgi:hypothetical protein
MGKRATDMTAEEHQAVIERMAKLREVANKKRMEMAAEKRGIKSDLKEAKAAELERIHTPHGLQEPVWERPITKCVVEVSDEQCCTRTRQELESKGAQDQQGTIPDL